MMKKISLLVLSLLLSNSGNASLEHNKVVDEALDVVLDEAAQDELRTLVVNAVLSGKLTQAQAEQILVGTKSSETASDKDLTRRYFAAGVVTGLALIGGGYCVYQLCKTSPKKDEATVPSSDNSVVLSGNEQAEVDIIDNSVTITNPTTDSDAPRYYNTIEELEADKDLFGGVIDSGIVAQLHGEGRCSFAVFRANCLGANFSADEDLFFVDHSLIPGVQSSPSHHSNESQSDSDFSTEVEEVVQLAQNSPSHHSDESDENESLYEVVSLSQRRPLNQADIAALNFEQEVNHLAQEGRRSPTPSQVSVASTNVSTASRRSNRVSVPTTHFGVYATPQQLSSALRNDKPAKKINTRRK